VEVKYLPSAKRRMIEIWDFTKRRWGEAQADQYLRGMAEAMDLAKEQPERWHPVNDEALPEVYFVRYQRHLLFFRIFSPDLVGVISILHDNMNIPIRLKEDAEWNNEE
jgi:plasmid stabilization system protein ParE